MAPPQYPCPKCGSTTFEETDGRWFCLNGDEQEGGQQIGEDDGDYGTFGKINRRKVVKEKQKITKVYRGVKGFQLFLKAWQHILWKQSYALIHEHGINNELWSVVRELWALRLSKLEDRLQNPTDIEGYKTDQSSNTESETDPIMDDGPKPCKTNKHASDMPSLSDTIALNYMGIVILQYPLRLSTIYNYIRQERICYIRAIRYVPQDIRERLAPEYHGALDTTVLPTQHDLQLAVYRTATMLGKDFGMVLPSLNWAPIMLSNIRDLSLPLEIFPAVKSLANTLGYNFAYPEEHDRRRNATTYPEAQLMALIVVATKLLFPLDSDTVKRFPQSINEPAAIKLCWKSWMSARAETVAEADRKMLTPEHAIEVTDVDVLQMKDSELDQYMDWFQKTYTKEVKVNHLYQQILDMFPVQDAPTIVVDHQANAGHERPSKHVKHTQAELKPQRVIPDSESPADLDAVIRPGQQYQRYRSIDELSEPAKTFHQCAAKLACLSVDSLLRACSRTERLLLLNQHERRRAEMFSVVDEGSKSD